MDFPKPTSGQGTQDNSRAERRRLSPSHSERTRKDESESAAQDGDEQAAEVDSRKDGNGVAVSASTTFGDDFIGFAPSHDSEDEDKVPEHRLDKGKGRETSPPIREWDKGKSRNDDRNDGRRRYDMVFDFGDGYGNKRQRIDANSRKAPWLDRFYWEDCHNVAEMLHREVEAFTNWISPTSVEDEVRGLVVTLITRAITRAFPDAQIHPFGSYETKLYMPLGDIDLVITSQSMAYSDRQTVLYALANCIKRAKIADKVRVIARAKVPIVKFVTAHGGINVDVSVNQQNGIISGSMINSFLEDMRPGGKIGKGSFALRSLVLITKAFLSQRNMNEVYTGGLGSYGIVCMAISFLQMHPKIRRGEIDPDKNLGVLVVEFFELYGHYFNYDEVGISVRNGGFYFKKKQRGWVDYQKGGLISIEDPADPSNDISKGSFGFQRVRMSLAGAHDILTSNAYLKAGMLNSRRDSRSYRLRDRYEPQDVSILSSIMGVTQETINHRRLVQEVYNQQVLHRLVGSMPKTAITRDANGATEAMKPLSSIRSTASKRDILSTLEDSEDEHVNNFRQTTTHDDDEEGRYHIVRRRTPPHKRQRTGKRADLHTVFTTDDETEDTVLSLAEPSEMQAGEYIDHDEESKVHHHHRRPRSREETDKRRSYWLAKGNGIPEPDEDHVR